MRCTCPRSDTGRRRRDHGQLDARAWHDELGDDRRAGRKGLGEVLPVDRVEGAEVARLRQVGRDLHDVLQREADGLLSAADAAQAELRLGCDALRHGSICGEGQFTGQEDQAMGAADLG